ncbi:MAG TPA: Clp protease N-terminal domain-containing protein [Candidatus Angelobacter sp.]|nr:Clp protease N-terminal domain-containing protein [Candidatus Angelobacter sp.]
MYERYTVPARRAVFFAVWYARLEETQAVDSVHLLKGLMYQEDFRANTIFSLREHFPLYSSYPCKFATGQEVPKRPPVLTNDAKSAVYWTALEADALRDYWINTEHMLLGILAVPGCPAAQYLAKTGLTQKDARRLVMENKASQPDYGPVPRLWKVQSSVEHWILRWPMRIRRLRQRV